MTAADPDVVVVGAGLAGLAAANEVHRAGRSVAVLESSDGVGGRVRTDMVEGCRLDRGFQVLLTAYPELSRHFDVDALALRRFHPGALIWLGEGFCRVADPLRVPGRLWETISAPVGGPMDKLRLAALVSGLVLAGPRSVLRRPDIPTSQMLSDRGFSDDMVERIFRPLLGGIMLDPSLASSRRFAEIVLRCLAVGRAAVPSLGMQAVPDQLAARLPPGTVRLGQEVVSVSRGSVTTFSGEALAPRAVVVATDGDSAARLLGEKPGSHLSATCVWYSASRPPVPDPLIILDGTGEGPAVNVAVMTNVAPTYSNDGRAVIAAALPGVADGDAEPRVREQLARWWGGQVREWRHLRTHVLHYGHPGQGPPFHPKRSVVRPDGLFVCGDHRDTPSVQGALYSGRRCAAAVLGRLNA